MRTSPAAFMRQFKQEVSKITWPTRSETTQMTFMVLFACALLAAFFFVVDYFSAVIVKTILGA